MSILVSLHHITHYTYDHPVELGMQTVRLRPAPHVKSPINSYSLKITPKDHFLNWQQDPFGNFLAKVVFPEKVTEFKIEVDLLTEIRVFNPFDFFLEESAKSFPLVYEASLKEELSPYLEIKEKNTSLLNWVKGFQSKKLSMIDFLVGVNQKLNQTLRYTLRLEPGVQSCEETLSLGSGSCRDMAWFLCQALRHLGLATRFASGYLIQLTPDVKSLDGPSGTEIDFTDLHAWTEVYLPGAGWIGLDPTSGLFTGEGHIPLCCTPNPSSAAPVTGTFEKNTQSKLHHEMTVSRLVESPRVTKPYTNDQWQAIDALGVAVDKDLKKHDVRLTMGGEPTFVSVDDREGDQWHFTALDKDLCGGKKKLAKNLLHRLMAKFSKGGVYMVTQGKWYPGEMLPRWALPCFWRKDGQPIWKDPSLLADPDVPANHKTETAEAFILDLAHAFGIPDSYVVPLREDAPYYLWKDGRLPLQEEILSTDILERAEQERLQKLMDKDLNAPVGFALPLHYSHTRNGWISNKWTFKSGYAVLLTGDSPAGLRLPLGSLDQPKGFKEELTEERCSFEKVGSLPAYKDLCKGRKVNDALFKNDPSGLIHTALCVEVRDGVLHLFMPPISFVEHALELLAVIESVSKKCQTPIVLEGYVLPSDPRLSHFSVTPDPGVIEVNIQPAEDWEDIKHITNTVYEEAHQSRLSAEKFLQDGRRVGTGGGNHLVMGARHPDDSPFLRRPDLLKSLIGFWQAHPALSYLFAGLYIGPTSQSPRIDEARHDSLYELEIAFQQISLDNKPTSPWLVDRLFRNLLVDLTGNTHRAEFCIDKLFSPDSDRGRLGLLEMRSFEMTPHPQMNLVQSLFLRACIAAFWNKPYSAKLVRWGSMLHDQFMLAHYIEEDMKDVLSVLKNEGYIFDFEWFRPFFAFRLPEIGCTQVGGIDLSLRTALEPWPVMGEENQIGGTSRSVDATVERLEVRTKGMIEGRHLLTCNGRPVPLRQTSENGLKVAGVRFKAWRQPSSLHPQLPIDAPLVFDIIDLEKQKSLGGCTYHVSHPGGRSYKTFPVNENEAEGRRIARFQAMGHTAGKIQAPELEKNNEFPCTLDLRFKGI